MKSFQQGTSSGGSPAAQQVSAAELESASCPLCGDSASSRFLFHANDRIFGISGEHFRYVECERCGLVRLDPRPTPALMARYYDGTDRLIREGGGRTAGKRPLLNAAERLFRGARARKILKRIDPGPGGRVLDIGSGPGSFLRYFGDAAPGTTLLGLDNSAEACKWAANVHGQTSVCGDALFPPFKGGSFDIVTLWHFIEHSYDPVGTLKGAAGLLKPGGLLVLEVPNYDGPLVRAEGGRWFGLMTPLHLYQFTPDTMRKLLESCGFRVTGVEHRLFIPNLAAGFLLGTPKRPRGGRGLVKLAPLFVFSAMLEWPAALLASASERGYVMTVYATPW